MRSPDSTKPLLPPVYISSLHYPWATIEEACARCSRQLMLDGVEFSVRDVAGGRHLPPQEAEGAGRTAREYDLRISVHVWDDLPQLGREEGVALLGRYLNMLCRMRASYLVLHGGSHDDRSEGLRCVRSILAEAAGRFEGAGKTICLENHYAYDYHQSHELFSTPEEYEELFDSVQSPAIRACLDYGHSHMNNNTEDMLSRLAPHLAYVHLADNAGVNDDHVAFGAGTIDWQRILRRTHEVGYNGPFTIEFPVSGPDDPVLRRCLGLLRTVYARA